MKTPAGAAVFVWLSVPTALWKFITPIKEGSYLCDGDVEIDELEQLLGFELEHEDFTTLNGLFVQKLGKIPKKGDTLKVEDYRLTVIKGSTKKADLISIHKEV